MMIWNRLALHRVSTQQAVAQINLMLRQAQHERKSHTISIYHRSPCACRWANGEFGQHPVKLRTKASKAVEHPEDITPYFVPLQSTQGEFSIFEMFNFYFRE
jgi:hypothetical protein